MGVAPVSSARRCSVFEMSSKEIALLWERAACIIVRPSRLIPRDMKESQHLAPASLPGLLLSEWHFQTRVLRDLRPIGGQEHEHPKEHIDYSCHHADCDRASMVAEPAEDARSGS